MDKFMITRGLLYVLVPIIFIVAIVRAVLEIKFRYFSKKETGQNPYHEEEAARQQQRMHQEAGQHAMQDHQQTAMRFEQEQLRISQEAAEAAKTAFDLQNQAFSQDVAEHLDQQA